MADSKKKIKIDIAIFVAIFIILIVFCLFPLLSKISETAKGVALKKEALKSLEGQIDVLQDYQGNVSNYEKSIKKLNSIFISSEAPVEFIGFLEGLANKYGLGISISSVKDVFDKKENRITTSFQTTVSGDYPVALVFLRKIEQSPWLIKIEQVDIARVEKDLKINTLETAKDGQVIMRLGFKTFSNYLEKTP